MSELADVVEDRMTVRVYLAVAAVRFLSGPPEATDLPAERVFVHASQVPEVWVETESRAVPAPGRTVAFALAWHMEIGFERVVGTVERTVTKRARRPESDG